MKKQKTKDAVAILHKLFIKGDSERLAAIEAEREKIKIAEQIYALRQERGFTQKELADKIGTTQSVISRLENTDYESERIETLQKLAVALDCSLEVRFVPKGKATTTTAECDNIDQVWKNYYETHSDKCRNILMNRYLYLVKYTAERIWIKLPDKVALDDLIQAGIFGLMDAIDAFDAERGVKFETYCAPRIRGSILDELRSVDWVPRLIRARAHQLETAEQTLETKLGRKPTEEELADEMELDKIEFQRLQRDANAIGLLSLNNKFNESEDEQDIREIDIIKDQESKNPVTEAQKRDLKDLLSNELTRAEKLIIFLYYYDEMSLREIGSILDLSEPQVSQMLSSVIARMKAQMHTRRKEYDIRL